MPEATYEIRVSGTIPPGLLTELSGLDIAVQPCETVLCGSLPDQPALFGLLARIHGFGLCLIGVRRLAGGGPPGGPPAGGGTAPAEGTGADR